MASRLDIYRRFAYHAARGGERRLRARLPGGVQPPPDVMQPPAAAPQADPEPAPAPAEGPPDLPTPPPPGDPSAEPEPDTDVWGGFAKRQAASESLGWLDNGWLVRTYVFPKVFGAAVSDRWGLNAVEAFGIPRGGRWLSLGCGSGDIESQMAEDDLFGTMVALDASPGAIDVARTESKRRGVDHKIHFDTADLNSVVLPPEAYDVVHMNMALHHIHALEHLAYQINRTLVDGGVFLANEFVGSNQFQYPDERLDMVRQRLSMLPERLRWNPVAREVKTEYPRFSRTHWNAYDPTESVRSDDIPHVLRVNFPRLRRYDYGGPILNLLLENIVQNFDLDSPDDRRLLEDLFDYEQAMIRAGVLESEFAYFVCPRGSRLDRARGALAAKADIRHRVTMALRSRALD